MHERVLMEKTEGGVLRVAAPAKINLNLLVGHRQADGFHPLDSLVAKVSLHDTLHLGPRSDGKISFSSMGLPCGPDVDNLAYRAAEQLAERARVAGLDAGGVEILLEKRIPPGGGMGGGSSDAAAVLAGLNLLWHLDLPEGELAAMGVELGSDVPLFLAGPASRMTGRGERLEPVEVHPFWAVLVLGDIASRTAEVYEAFDANPPEPLGQLDPAELAAPPSTWRAKLVNQLAEPAMRLNPPLAELFDRVRQALGEIPLHLTGSGSGLFCLCDDRAETQDILDRFPDTLRSLCLVVKRSDR
jgi:4-diphosphocytidyl-2-C-methyl-D-erythritol kinase